MTRHRLLTAAVAVAVAASAALAAGAVLRGTREPLPAPAAATAETPQTAAARAERAGRAADASGGDAAAHGVFALAALDAARETGDPTWYSRADRAATDALRGDPRDTGALDAAATLAAVRHDFRGSLAFARRSMAAEPARFAPVGIAADALIELGRYEAGFAGVARRLSLRPDLSSYSRASYVRELVGDRHGAVALMELAVDAARPGGEGRAWARVQLGLLHLGSGDVRRAEAAMRRAVAERPGDARAVAGLARVHAARGRLDAAARGYRRALDLLPAPEYAAALAEVEHARGDRAAEREALGLVDAMTRLLAQNGVRTDLDLSLIHADTRRPGAAAVARARAAHRDRPGVVGDDVLGWVLTRAGHCDEGLRHARRALRLGTRDALMLFHAGMAARCAGHPAEAATRLRAALALNPAFSVRFAPVARDTLREVTR